jgi:hypothetical protein
MSHLYDARTWTIDEPNRPREYVISANDEVLANVTRVPMRRPDDAAMPYANPHAQYDETRTVVCAASPDGATPFFYVDRTNDSVTGPAPALVVAPDGSRIGAIAVNHVGLRGIFKLMSGQGGGRGGGFALLDASGRPLATVLSPGPSNPAGEGTITDSGGTEIARYSTELSPYAARRRRHTVRVHQPLAEPLHTLVLASLLGVELMTPQL